MRPVVVFLVVALSVTTGHRARAQDQKAGGTIPAINGGIAFDVALCPECASLAAEVNALKGPSDDAWRRVQELSREYRALGEQMAELDARYQEANRRGDAAAAQLREQITGILQRRVELSRLQEQAERAWRESSDRYHVKRRQLLDCNRRCALPATGEPPTIADVKPDVAAGDPAPGAACKECQPLADQLHATGERLSATYRAKVELLDRRDALRSEIDRLAGQRNTLLQGADANAPENRARLDALDEAWRRAASEMMAADGATAAFNREEERLARQMGQLKSQLAECNTRCLTTGGSPPAAAPTSTGGEPSSACPNCDGREKQIAALRNELKDLYERLDNIASQVDFLDTAIRNEKDPGRRESLEGQRDMVERAQGEARSLEREKSRQLDDLRRELDECNKKCTKPTAARQVGSILSQPKVYGPILGGAALVAGLAAGGGGTTTPPAAPSVTTPPPAPPGTAAPPSTPVPPSTPAPTPTATGNYVCVSCAVRSDPGGHNPFVNLCPRMTGVVNVVQASLTLRHPAPFVDVTGDNFNASTGAFDVTGRGTVAGFNNVGVRATGAANTGAGRITFDYTMGTGGELPGGQPIVYSLTLQKQ